MAGQSAAAHVALMPNLSASRNRMGEVGRMYQHLGGDAASIQARAAEAVSFDHGDAPAGKLLGRQRISASRSDDDEVIGPRGHGNPIFWRRLAHTREIPMSSTRHRSIGAPRE